jgi:nucleotide-binding universal stress UspA family protein
MDIPALVDSEMKKSSDAAAELMARFEELARQAGVYQESVIKQCYASEAPDLLVREARLRDLTILSAVPEDYNYGWYAEAIVFGSGRPVLILPPQVDSKFTLDRVVVAWDGSRPAARAVADALPLLEQAREVQVLTVLKEKELSGKSPARELTEYLKRRGIHAKPNCVDAAGQTIGKVLTSDLGSRQVDLLVMGAYGHSRIREFILGGATQSMLSSPPVPLFVSH